MARPKSISLVKDRIDPGPAPFIPPRPDIPITEREYFGWGYKTGWLAVKTNDMNAVALALGLREPGWAPWKEAIELAYSYDADFRSWHWMVTPPIQGWVLVMSLALIDRHFDRQDVREEFHASLSQLSEKFGEVQFFGTYRVSGIDAWGRWMNGHCLRLVSFDAHRGLEQHGNAQSSTEAELLIPEIHTCNGEEYEFVYLGEDKVVAMAAEWSLDPTQLDAHSAETKKVSLVLTGWLPLDAKISVTHN